MYAQQCSLASVYFNNTGYRYLQARNFDSAVVCFYRALDQRDDSVMPMAYKNYEEAAKCFKGVRNARVAAMAIDSVSTISARQEAARLSDLCNLIRRQQIVRLVSIADSVNKQHQQLLIAQWIMNALLLLLTIIITSLIHKLRIERKKREKLEITDIRRTQAIQQIYQQIQDS